MSIEVKKVEAPARNYDGCSCHINPPCNFCCSLTEKEADVFSSGGMDALNAFRDNEESRCEFYKEMVNHVGHVGLHLDMKPDGSLELRCCARTHGGEDVLLLTVRDDG